MLFMAGCRTAAPTNDPLVGLPPQPIAMLPALKIVEQPKEQPKYLPPSITLGHPMPIEPEPKYLPPPQMPELPPLPPLFPDN